MVDFEKSDYNQAEIYEEKSLADMRVCATIFRD